MYGFFCRLVIAPLPYFEDVHSISPYYISQETLGFSHITHFHSSRAGARTLLTKINNIAYRTIF